MMFSQHVRNVVKLVICIQTVKNKACHRLFIQCENCAERFEGCCSESCVEELSLSDEEINALIAERAADPTFFTKGRS